MLRTRNLFVGGFDALTSKYPELVPLEEVSKALSFFEVSVLERLEQNYFEEVPLAFLDLAFGVLRPSGTFQTGCI